MVAWVTWLLTVPGVQCGSGRSWPSRWRSVQLPTAGTGAFTGAAAGTPVSGVGAVTAWLEWQAASAATVTIAALTRRMRAVDAVIGVPVVGDVCWSADP
jgi:hypothetical protein